MFKGFKKLEDGKWLNLDSGEEWGEDEVREGMRNEYYFWDGSDEEDFEKKWNFLKEKGVIEIGDV